MSTTKQDCLNFIKARESLAIDKLRLKYAPAISSAKSLALMEYQSRLDRIQSSIDTIASEMDLLATDMREDTKVSFIKQYGTKSSLIEFSGGKYKHSMINACTFNNDKIIELNRSYRREVEQVRAEYTKIEGVISNERSAKKIIKILEEIGFDVGRLKDTEQKSLVPKVNKDLLGIGGN